MCKFQYMRFSLEKPLVHSTLVQTQLRNLYSEVSFLPTPEEWKLITEGGRELMYHNGDVVVHRGQTLSSLFQVLRGQCDVRINGHIVGNIKENEIFGEMTFIMGGPATADVIGEFNIDVESMIR